MISVNTFQNIIKEHERACLKHDWTGYTIDQMIDAVYGEDKELKETEERMDINGEHGIIAEALHGIATRIRMIESIK